MSVRDHRAAYERRNQLAQQRGYRSYAQQRRFERVPNTEAALKALPESARKSRRDALDVIHQARIGNVTVTEAARDVGVPLTAVAWWGQPALVNPASRAPFARRADRMLRYTPLVVDGHLEFVATRGSNAAAKARAAFAAQCAYLEATPGSEGALARFDGVRVGGRLVETDHAVLDEIARRGEFADLEDMYRAWVAS